MGRGPYGYPAAGAYDVRDRAAVLAERGVPGASDLAELASRLEYVR